jgi:hypothetical protein
MVIFSPNHDLLLKFQGFLPNGNPCATQVENPWEHAWRIPWVYSPEGLWVNKCRRGEVIHSLRITFRTKIFPQGKCLGGLEKVQRGGRTPTPPRQIPPL